MTRCDAYWSKVKNLLDEDDREGLEQFCKKNPETIKKIVDHIEYCERNFDKSSSGTLVPIPERTARPLRALERDNPTLHNEVLSEVIVLNKPTTKEIKAIIREKRNSQKKKPKNRKDVILSDIRDIRLKDVDLILTDPPYPKEYLGLWSVLFEKAEKGLKEGGFLVTYAPHIYLPEIFEASRPLNYVWAIAQIHAGERTAYHPSRVNIGWKPILVFVKGDIPDIDYFDDVLQGAGREKDDHEWQQALDESETLIQMFSSEGSLVVDPFVGSGTTALAARNTGRNFLVFDNDEEAIQTTLRRLSE